MDLDYFSLEFGDQIGVNDSNYLNNSIKECFYLCYSEMSDDLIDLTFTYLQHFLTKDSNNEDENYQPENYKTIPYYPWKFFNTSPDNWNYFYKI